MRNFENQKKIDSLTVIAHGRIFGLKKFVLISLCAKFQLSCSNTLQTRHTTIDLALSRTPEDR